MHRIEKKMRNKSDCIVQEEKVQSINVCTFLAALLSGNRGLCIVVNDMDYTRVAYRIEI